MESTAVSETEKKVEAVWKSVLGVEHDIGIEAHFFTDLGGNSLQAGRVTSLIRKSTGVMLRDVSR